jgi:hypothetical protein
MELLPCLDRFLGLLTPMALVAAGTTALAIQTSDGGLMPTPRL